jgi:hypothetical protein
MNVLKATAASKVARVGVALGVASVALIGLAPFSDAAVKFTLTPATGPAATAGKVITVTGSGFKSAAGANLVHAAYFATAACATTEGSGTNATAKSTVSATRLVLTVPSLALSSVSATSTAYNLCVYSTATNNPLIGSGTYTVYPAPTVTSVTPSSGASYGGQTITVSGTHLSAKTTATLGGVAVTGIKAATDGTSFTAVTPAGTGSNVALVVTTEGGSVTNSTYDYTTAVSVTPSSATAGVATPISVKGKGFTGSGMDFSTTDGTTSNDTNAHVYLVQGTYDATDDTTGAKTVAQTAECTDVQVVSDTEVVCNVPASVGDGAYTVTVVDDGTVDATIAYQSVVSAGATVTVSDF